MTRQLTPQERDLQVAEEDMNEAFGCQIATDLFCDMSKATWISPNNKRLSLDNTAAKFQPLGASLFCQANRSAIRIFQLGSESVLDVEIDMEPSDFSIEKTRVLSRWVDALNEARAAVFYEKCRIIRGDDGHRMVSSREHGDIYVVPVELLGGDVPPKGSKTLVLRSVLADIRRSARKAILDEKEAKAKQAASSSSSSKVNERMAISLEAGSPHSRVYFSDPNWVTMEARLSVRRFTGGLSLLITEVKIGDVSWKTRDHSDDDAIRAHRLVVSKFVGGPVVVTVWVENEVVARVTLDSCNTHAEDQRDYEALVGFLFKVDRAREENLAKMRSKAASSSSASSKGKDPAPKTITLSTIPGEENKIAVSEEGESTLVPSKSAFQVDYDGPNTVIQVLHKTWKISNSAVEFKYHTLCGCADLSHSSVKFGGELVAHFVGSDNLIVRQHLLAFLIKVDEERRKRFYRECKIVYRTKEYFGAKTEELDSLVEIHRDWLPNPDKIACQSTVLVLRSLFDRRGPANATPRRMTIPSTKENHGKVGKRVISQDGTSAEYVFRNLEAPLTPQLSSREQKDAVASTPVERLTAEAAVREAGAAEIAAYNEKWGQIKDRRNRLDHQMADEMVRVPILGKKTYRGVIDKPEPTTVRCLTCGHVSPTSNETPCRCRASEEDQEPEQKPLDTTVPSAKPAVAEVAKNHSLPVVARLYPSTASVTQEPPAPLADTVVAKGASLFPFADPVTQESHVPLAETVVTTSGPNIYKGVTTSGLRMSYNSETRRLRIIGGECTVPELEKGKTCSAPTVTVRYEETKPKFLSVAMGYRGLKYCLMSTDDAHYAAIFCQDVADWLLKLHDDKIF